MNDENNSPKLSHSLQSSFSERKRVMMILLFYLINFLSSALPVMSEKIDKNTKKEVKNEINLKKETFNN